MSNDVENASTHDDRQYTEEAKRRWGDTAAFHESVRRTKGYTAEDWRRIREENEAIERRMVDAYDRDVEPTAAEATDIAEAARRAIDRVFYPCTHEMHAVLAKMYVADGRFRAHYNDLRTGLAAWFGAAIRANAERAAERSA